MRHALIVTGILLLVGLSWWLHLHNADPLPLPALIASTTARAVVDLLVPLDQPLSTTLPGTPQRFLIAEIRDGAAVVGWASKATDHPLEVLCIAASAGRVIAWPARAPARGVVVEAYASTAAAAPLAHVEITL